MSWSEMGGTQGLLSSFRIDLGREIKYLFSIMNDVTSSWESQDGPVKEGGQSTCYPEDEVHEDQPVLQSPGIIKIYPFLIMT